MRLDVATLDLWFHLHSPGIGLSPIAAVQPYIVGVCRFPMHVRPVAAGLRSDRTDAFINEQSPRPNKVYANLIILMTLFACNEAYLVASIGAVGAIINCAAVRFSVPIVSSLCDDRAKSERILDGRLVQELCGYKSG